MEMTIDKAKERLRQWLKNGSNGLTDTRLGYIEGWFHKTDKEAFEIAIDTMRKYQKIQEIVRWNNAPSPYYKPDGQLFREICELQKSEE